MLAIEIKGLNKSFGPKQALRGVTLNVEQGEVFGFIGPNGAGKSTTIRCLMDFIRPSSGAISILGMDAQADSVSLKSRVSYLSADSTLYQNWSGKEHIDFVAAIRGVPRERAKTLATELDFNPKPKVHQLSSGNRQKLGLILAMMVEPEVLILDEPTRGLDPLLQVVFQRMMRKYCDNGGTVFMSSHNLPEVEQICTDIAVIREGKTVANETMQSLIQKSAHTVRVTFRSKPDLTLLKQIGVKSLSQVGDSVTFSVHGDLNPVLHHLVTVGVRDLEITHASLEELFMELYK
jgi:ABC-2 type transport system ATP-binding protein